MDEKTKQQIIQLIQLAQQGDKRANQAIQNIAEKAKQGDKEAIQLVQNIQAVMEEMTRKAQRGAKLNYIRSLAHKCAEDEELVYYKKGGRVDCGCVKKDEKGGKVKDQAAKDSVEINKYGDTDLIENKGHMGTWKPVKNQRDGRTHVWVPNRKKYAEESKSPKSKLVKAVKDEKGAKIKVSCGGSKMLLGKGGKACPKCGKVHSGPCKHREGGRLTFTNGKFTIA